jgi:uncharacterized protein (DUF885 family)
MHSKILILLSLFLLVPRLASAEQEVVNELNELMEQVWQFELSINPTYATSLGVHQYDDQLVDMSGEALAEKDKQMQRFLKSLNQIDSTQLDRTSQINLIMQKRRVKNYVDEYRFKAHFAPITSEYGFHSGLAGLPRTAKFNSLKDYQNYLARLAQIPRYFEQQIYWMKQGMAVGLVQPKVVLKDFELSVKPYFEGKPQDSVFYSPFKQFTQLSIDQSQQIQLQKQAARSISENVFTAYRAFYDFLVNEYIPNAKSDIASKTWPMGSEYYQNRTEYYTTTQMSADQIHQTGLQEVARIRAEMQQVIEQLKFEGDINQFIDFLRTDPQFYAKSADELLKHASYFAKKIDAKLPQLFYKLPRTPYGVEPVPDNIAPKYTTGRYISPTRDDQPGYYWVNTYALDKRPLYAIPALTLHEAVPGHHLQISLAREMTDLPPVRRYTYISAFGEGWGLYSEFLGKEVGIYDDPYDEFGRLSYEMRRACRLVVDTGMHLKGWSRQRALDYMLENTALSEHNVTTEIDRYISWPAQALSYKIGEIEIKKLRLEAEKALGDDFDLRAFHDAILAHGSVPLSVLRENISQFINSQKKSG